MSDLWQVFKKDGSELGLFTSAEIREALRQGKIDPFDQVCRQGSNVRVELVEVDEIFAEPSANEGRRDSIYSSPPEKIEKSSSSYESEEDDSYSDAPANSIKTTLLSGSNNNMQGPVENTVTTTPVSQFPMRGSKKAAKAAKKNLDKNKKLRRYHLIDKRKRLLGPLSAAEIQSLFYRGILEKNVKVAKDKDGRKIPIAQFVAAYAGENAKKFESENTRIDLDPIDQSQMGFPSVKVMDQMTRTAVPSKPASKVVPVLSIALMCVLVVLGYFAIDQILTENKRKAAEEVAAKARVNEPARSGPMPSLPPAPPQPQQQPVPSANEQARMRESERSNNRTKRSSTAALPKSYESPSQRYVPAPAPALPPPPPPAPVVMRKQAPRQEEKPKVARKRAAPRVEQEARVSERANPARVSKPIQEERPTKLAARQVPQAASSAAKDPFEDKIGDVGTFAGMQFDKGALSSCGLKCTLMFKDSSGNKLQGIFFKGQYEEKLSRSSGKVTISGRVAKQGSGYVIYLSGVK